MDAPEDFESILPAAQAPPQFTSLLIFIESCYWFVSILSSSSLSCRTALIRASNCRPTQSIPWIQMNWLIILSSLFQKMELNYSFEMVRELCGSLGSRFGIRRSTSNAKWHFRDSHSRPIWNNRRTHTAVASISDAIQWTIAFIVIANGKESAPIYLTRRMRVTRSNMIHAMRPKINYKMHVNLKWFALVWRDTTTTIMARRSSCSAHKITR